MSVIYGLRCVGDEEVRYIGRSNKPLELRLHKHITNAAYAPYPRGISNWIREAGDIEIVALVECADEEATRVERATVELYHALGHRLTNSHLVPRQNARGSLPCPFAHGEPDGQQAGSPPHTVETL